jgi:hypothetical protein
LSRTILHVVSVLATGKTPIGCYGVEVQHFIPLVFGNIRQVGLLIKRRTLG